MIKVETAGGGGAHNSNMMSMIGINDAEEFKELILKQREIVIREKNQQVSSPTQANVSGDKILLDIKNELTEIKTILKNRS